MNKSHSYSKETNCAKNRQFNADPVNYKKTLKRITLANIRKGKNSVVGIISNEIILQDVINDYIYHGILEQDIPWSEIHVDVLKYLNNPTMQLSQTVIDKLAVKKDEIIKKDEKIKLKLKSPILTKPIITGLSKQLVIVSTDKTRTEIKIPTQSNVNISVVISMST